jgi:flagellar basal body-associated protein FliL
MSEKNNAAEVATEDAKTSAPAKKKFGGRIAIIAVIVASVALIGGVVAYGLVVQPQVNQAKNVVACEAFQAGLAKAEKAASLGESLLAITQGAAVASEGLDAAAKLNVDLLELAVMSLQDLSAADDAMVAAVVGYSQNVQAQCATILNVK